MSYLHVAEAGGGDILEARREHVRKVTAGWLINQRSPQTRRTYQQTLRKWWAWCEGKGIDATNPTRQEVAAWVAEQSARGLAPATVCKDHAIVKSWHKELTLEAARPNTDCHLGVKLPPVPDESPARLLSDDEVVRLLAVARGRKDASETAIAMMALMGFRAGEAGHVSGREVQATAWGPMLAVKGKGGRTKLVPIPQLVLDAAARHGWPGKDLAEFVPYQPRRAYDRVWKMTKRVAEEAGIPDLHPHMLRHWYCTAALREGVPESHVQESMRHAKADTTRRYDRLRQRTENHATHTISRLIEARMGLRAVVPASLPPPTGMPVPLPPPVLR